MSLSAVVLDLDGVIVKTNFVKHDAMLSLFAEYPAQERSISEFILSNGGVPRKDKLAGPLRAILSMAPSEAQLLDCLRRCATTLEHLLSAASTVEGVGAFIKD